MAVQICSGQTSYTNPNATLAVTADAARLNASTVRITLHWNIWTASSSLNSADRWILIVTPSGWKSGGVHIGGSWAYNTSYSGNAVIDVGVGATDTGFTFGCKVLAAGDVGGQTLTWDGSKGTNTGNPAIQYGTVSFPAYTATITISHQIVNVANSAWSQSKMTTAQATAGTTFTPSAHPTAITGFYCNTTITNSASPPFTVSGNRTVNVYYYRNSMSVSVDNNGGSGGKMTWSTIAWYGGNGTLTPPMRQGYTFTGWTRASGTFGLSGNSVTNVTASGSVKANWRANTYTLTYDGSGGSTPAAKSVTYDAAYGTLATSERRGFEFIGWFTSPAGGSQVTAATVCKGNSTVYAHWKVKTLYDRVIIQTAEGPKLAKPYIGINGAWVGSAALIGDGTKWKQTAINPELMRGDKNG